MISNWWGFPAAAECGVWSAVLGPMITRNTRLFLMRRSHHGDGTIAVRDDPRPGWEGHRIAEPIKTFAVKMELVEVEEGEMPGEPTIAGGGVDSAGRDDVRDFLQACVDCAAQMGIVPTNGAPDLSGELNATRVHLEDMRCLALGDKHQPLPARRS